MSNPNHLPTLRFLLAFKVATLVVCVFCLVWMVLALREGALLFGITEGLAALAALICWVLIQRGSLAMALTFAEFSLLAVDIVICLMFDTPTAAVPRVTHLFLLPLAALCYINYLRTGARSQLLLIALSLIAFICFSSSTFILPFAEPLPDKFRSVGSWVNASIAIGLLCCCLYVMQLHIEQGKGVIRELKSAIWNDELELFYQKQVDVTGRIIGCEALLRWKHPVRGYVSPGEFIPLAEQAGMMPQIGGWVIAEACKTLARWQDDPALAPLSISVNVSADQFLTDDFERLIFDTLALHQVSAHKLKLELTESVVVADIEKVIARMNALRAAGLTISLDDFGTGYSSLSYLGRLPLHQLKIDRSFVRDAVDSSRGAALIANIVRMGRDLELSMTAEGIETEQEFAFLRELGCHEFQGYLFGRPVSQAAFEQDARQLLRPT